MEQKTKGMEEIEKAIIAFYRIVALSKYPTDDQISMASFMLKNYEQQKQSDYVYFLLKENMELRDRLREKELAPKETI